MSIETMTGRTVLIVGDVMLDEYIWGDMHRISPEAPVPVVEIKRRSYVPGGAANVAANVVSLGGRALLGGVVGHDTQAGQLNELLGQQSISAAGLMVDETRPTTTKTRIVAHNQQVVRVDSEQRSLLAADLEDTLLAWIQQQSAQAEAFVLSDYAKGVVSPRLAQGLIELARAMDKPVVVDPKGIDYTPYRRATVVTPNLQEAERAAHCEVNGPADLLAVGERLLDLLEGSAILITRGAQGMSLFINGQTPVHIPVARQSVFDVTGAGDTVIGTLALALAAGEDLLQAALLANYAASIVVGKVGTATLSIEELDQSNKPAG